MRKPSLVILVSLLVLGCWGFKPLSTPTQTDLDLGAFSISLAVKDISASKTFYEALGFAPLEGAGSIEQNWMILKQGNTKIGLFQGMFPSNTLTFNPTDARPFHKVLKDNEVEMVYEMGLETQSGPCSFSFLDPDGNAILVDQHKP